jgi:hypothetical protein
VGLVARAIVARIGGQDESSGAVGREHDTITSGSIAATLLYH